MVNNKGYILCRIVVSKVGSAVEIVLISVVSPSDELVETSEDSKIANCEVVETTRSFVVRGVDADVDAVL